MFRPLRIHGRFAGLRLYAVCWLAVFAAVALLRFALLPAEEKAAYARVRALQVAVDRWNREHPGEPMTDLNEEALRKAGYRVPPPLEDERLHFFLGETPFGLRVKCNLYADNPLVLRLVGVSLLALLPYGILFTRHRRDAGG